MGLFLQKLEKSLRLSTRAHIIGLPLDTGAGGCGTGVHPLRDQGTPVAGGCGLSPEQQLLVDVLKQLYKIREEREKAERQRRSSNLAWRAAAPSHDHTVVEFLDEFAKVVAVCQAVLSQRRAGEATPGTAAAIRKRKLDWAGNDEEEEMKWEDQERKEQRAEEKEKEKEEEEDVQIQAMMAHLRKRAKVVVGDKVCWSERSISFGEGPMAAAAVEVGGPEGRCIVTLVQQVAATMTAAAANHRRVNKRGWVSSAALGNGWSESVQEKRRRTAATTAWCSPPAGRKRKWDEDWGAANQSSVRTRGSLHSTANTKDYNNNDTINLEDCDSRRNRPRASVEKRKKLSITIVVTPA